MTRELVVYDGKAYYNENGVIRVNSHLGRCTGLSREFREELIELGYLTDTIKMSNICRALKRYEGHKYDEMIDWVKERVYQTNKNKTYLQRVEDWEELRQRFNGRVAGYRIGEMTKNSVWVTVTLTYKDFNSQVRYFKANRDKLYEYAVESLEERIGEDIKKFRKKYVQVLPTSEIEYMFITDDYVEEYYEEEIEE